MKPILRILAYLKHFPWKITFNVFFNVLHIVFNLGSYVMIVPFVELLFGMGDVPAVEPQFTFSQQGLADYAFWHLHRQREAIGLWPCLLWVSGGYLACSFLSNLFRYLAMVFLASIRNGLIECFRNDLYHRITILPVSYFNRNRRGDLISRMSNDLTDVEWSVVSTLQSLVKDPINVLVFSATLLFVSWRLFVLFLVVLPCGVWLIARIGKSLKHNSQRGQEGLGKLFALLDESLASLRVIKGFGREDERAERFGKANADYTRSMVRVAMRRELSSPLSEILGTLALVIILIIGGWQVIDGLIQPSVFIFFVIVFARLIPPIQAVVKAYNSLQKGSASAQRFLEVLDADEVIVEKPNAPRLEGIGGGIEFKNVSFMYPNDKCETRNGEPAGEPNNPSFIEVLSHINLTIPAGQTVAIVGPSGAGKSTLVDLLPRFYDPTEGQILIDGRNIADLNINSVRSQFGIVSQDCILFNDTIAANIAFGGDFSLDEIRRAAQIAHADEFVDRLPQGYDTIVGDRGLNLSGGQRQRISIARAVLRNTPCLILDEATSALDSESEHAVQQALTDAMKGRTAIVIAHRLSTVVDVDRIIVLDKGHIVEEGTHQQLLAAAGPYSRMVAAQSFVERT